MQFRMLLLQYKEKSGTVVLLYTIVVSTILLTFAGTSAWAKAQAYFA